MHVDLTAATGIIEICEDDLIHVEVDWSAALAGFGSAAPASVASYVDEPSREVAQFPRVMADPVVALDAASPT